MNQVATSRSGDNISSRYSHNISYCYLNGKNAKKKTKMPHLELLLDAIHLGAQTVHDILPVLQHERLQLLRSGDAADLLQEGEGRLPMGLVSVLN